MTPAAAALLRDGLHDDAAQAEQWVADRRRVLLGRCAARPDLGLAVSSGCAAGGARTHAGVVADDAAQALTRLDDGTLTRCERCAAVLPRERLDSAPAAVRCVGCARRDVFDTRWCR